MSIGRTSNPTSNYTICTSSTRPASPSTGIMIYETDTGFVLVYDGSSWENISPIIPHTEAQSFVPGGTRTTTSSSYANWTASDSGASLTITKYRADTKLVIEAANTRHYNSAIALSTIGARVDGVDYDLITADPQASTEASGTGWNVVTGLAAGNYTVQLRVKRNTGTYTYGDGNSRVSLKATETF